MKMIPVIECIEDFDFYPRLQVNDQHVAYLAEALEAGSVFPPIIIERKTKRIVDGFHRCRAYRRAFGDTHEIEAVEKSYANDAEMFLDAARLNAAHGDRLSRADYARVLERSVAFGLNDIQVAKALNITVDKCGEIRTKRLAKATPRSVLGKSGMIPLKRTFQHMAGRVLSEEQVQANRRSSGMAQSFYVNQVIDMLETEMLDEEDEHLLNRLHKLFELLENKFSTAF